MNISIIVPCWNVEKYIKNLLLSFHMLDTDNITYEIIFVVEDNTTDRTVEVIKNYMFDMNYKILYSNGRTAGLARNVGVANAHGKYIWFVDADDWIINPDILQLVLYYFTHNDSNIVKIKFVSNYFTMEHYSMVWQYIFKTDFIRDIPFNNEKYFEDNDFTERMFKKLGDNMLYTLIVPSYFYNYNRPGSNTSILRGVST